MSRCDEESDPRYSTQVIRWLTLLVLSVALSACGKPRPRAPDQVVREEAPRKEPAFFDDLEMTKSQREKVLDLIDQLYEDFAEYDRTRLILLDETIAQIKQGKLEREKLLPLAEVTIAEFEKALPRGIEAMQSLHGVLTRTQREELVALFTEGRKLSDEERRQARNNKIARVLGLTTGQKATIYPSLFALYIKHWGTIGRFREALHEAQDAFIEDQFVAKDLAIASELELLAVGEVIFDALEIGMNNLTREQHATLAALLDSQLRSPNPTRSDERLDDTAPIPSGASDPIDVAPDSASPPAEAEPMADIPKDGAQSANEIGPPKPPGETDVQSDPSHTGAADAGEAQTD